jgi:hypothetical protein
MEHKFIKPLDLILLPRINLILYFPTFATLSESSLNPETVLPEEALKES